MYRPFFLAATLLLAGSAAAQTALPPTGKVKTKHKRGQAETETAATTAPATAPTDYSLPYAASITPAGLKTDLDVLASDAYEGRETGQKGQKMAADYIAKAFAADGLVGPVPGSDNPYLQHFIMNRVSLDPASTIQVGDKTYTQGKDFFVLLPGSFARGPATVKPTFAGYGIKEDKYSDMVTPPAAGSDLVVLLGQPLNKAGQPLLGAASPYGGSGLQAIDARGSAMRAAALSFLGGTHGGHVRADIQRDGLVYPRADGICRPAGTKWPQPCARIVGTGNRPIGHYLKWPHQVRKGRGCRWQAHCQRL
jgi:hypothetical protein